MIKFIAIVILVIMVLFGWPCFSAAENRQALPPSGPKTVTAVRAEEPIIVDGRLEEAVWKCRGCEGFIQNDPRDGEPATEKTEVWVAYDDKALYVAACCHDSDPQGIVSRLGRRDAQVDSDWFVFAVDPYNDKRTGYLFGVNPAGSILDRVLSNDINQDSTWDGVWEARTEINGLGWVVEMRIPLNQLRFPEKDEHVWGVNFRRVVQRKNETSSFAWVPKSEPAFVSKFAELFGIRGVKPGRNFELTPYVVGQAQFRPAEEGNPFETGSRGLGNAGLDLKVGLKSNLTLDATVNPDFGQVEVDPAVINLTAYETYYTEKRPFFIEGASIFGGFGTGGVYFNVGLNWPRPTLFYSRRIGRAPQGYITEAGWARVPDRSTILGAAKVTGKMGTWNVGFIGALTSSESAEIDRLGERLSQEVEPFTFYGAARGQKDIGRGRSGVGFMATGVLRDNDDPVLDGILNRRAFSLAVDGWHFLDEKRIWVVGGWLGGTRVEGSVQDIFRLQHSSMHYFQRPDAGHLGVDPQATSLSGWGGKFSLAKQNGRWIGLATVGVLSPGFNPNDLGFQYGASDVVHLAALYGRQWTRPGRVFRFAMAAAGYGRNLDFGGNKFYEVALAIFQAQLWNFWTVTAEAIYYPESLSKTLTRGGPLVLMPFGYQVDGYVSSDSRRNVVFESSLYLNNRPSAGFEQFVSVGLRWKPAPNLSFSVGPSLAQTRNGYQWVTRMTDAAMNSTYGRRYIFGRLDQRTIAAEIRVDWTFTPRLSLQAYLQPFLAVGAYDEFKELARPASFEWNVYGRDGSTIERSGGAYVVDPDGAGGAAPFAFGNPDFNLKSLRGTVVLRWEYLPGSLLYFVWTQNRADYAHPGDLRLGRDLSDLLTAPGDNVFLLKVSYRWNM